jgi:hypothetical protein
MILASIVLFCLAVIVGLYLVFLGVRHHRGSLVLGLGHAGIAVLALLLLIVQIFREPVIHKLFNGAVVLFLMALTGGLVLLGLREGRRAPPMIVVSLHAAMAGLALWLLILGYLQR